jgi:predicted transglutaminase-like cysteine proteinase
MELLKRVNRGVNLSIVSRVKSYGQNLEDGWTIAPETGDCNDYAVTKRHKLMQSGLSSSALRLSVVKTPSGAGHLVLVVVTTKGGLVLDNLTDTIRPWRNTGYEWLKIQSASDAKFWHEIKSPNSGPTLAQVDRRMHVADQ